MPKSCKQEHHKLSDTINPKCVMNDERHDFGLNTKIVRKVLIR